MKNRFKILCATATVLILAVCLAVGIFATGESYVASVDGVGYATEAEAAAAIKAGSTLELHADFESPINKSGVAYSVATNGFSVPGFISETHKVVLGEGSIELVSANANEIFTVSYSYAGISATQTAALGTLISAPSEFDVFPLLNEENATYTVLSWTLTEGESDLTVKANASAIPVTDTVAAAVVKWTDQEGVTVLDTDYYMPGAETALRDFDGTDIPDDTSPEWYSVGRVAWNTEDVAMAAAGLSSAGEYRIRAVVGVKAPDTLPDFKINLTLYSNYILNFYLPTNIDGVSDLTVSTNADETVKLTKNAPGTIDGKEYDRFSYIFGAADTRIVKFYVNYTVEGTRVSYELEYGVPTYAASAMQQLPCDAVCAKALVINMANYADKVLALTEQASEDVGAKAYETLIAFWQESYLTLYNGLSDSKFLEGGEIYVSDGVASTKNGDAMAYVDGLSFYFDTYAPAFMLRLSSAAQAIEGFEVYVSYGGADFVLLNESASEENCYFTSASPDEESQESLALSRMADRVVFEFRSGNETLGSVEYNLAAYINFLLDNAEENAAYTDAAKSLYAFALAAKAYRENNDSENGNLPCMDFNGDHYCDICKIKISDCHDGDLNHKCDVCSKKLNRLCLDRDKNSVCDVCGDSLSYKYVVVIGVDGGGAFFRDTATPNIDRIFADGAITYGALTEIPSISAQNWGSILHGVKAGVHGCTNTTTGEKHFPSDSDIPSFLRVIKEAWPDADVASITNWANISYGIVEEGFGIYKPFMDVEANNTDRETTDAILNYVSTCDPTTLFVQFNEVDMAGHGYGYGSETHLNKITLIDGYIGEIYDAYAAKGLLDETLFIVTADHGGTPTKEDGSVGGDHGGLTEAEMNVMFAATGKTVQSGEIGDMELRDTAAIVLYALGLEAPVKYTARVPSGIFGGVEAPEKRPSYVNKDSDRYHETEKTPAPDSDSYITNFITDKLVHYFPFDGNANDTVGGLTTAENVKVFYEDAYYGQGVNLESGYISIPEFSFGESSWTIATWMDTRGSAPDPVIIGNKDWNAGVNYGFLLAINQSGELHLNIGTGTARFDYRVTLPEDYLEGFMHLMLIIDKENSKIRIVIDFKDVYETGVSAAMLDVIYASTYLNIGQDGTGSYYPLTAKLDELMFFNSAFTSSDIEKLAAYYGKKVPTIRNHETVETPEEGSEGYISNYVDKYIGKDLVLYMPFDGNVNAVTGQTTSTSGSVSYEDGFFGEALRVNGGSYASVDNITLGTGSYTFSFWLKLDEAQDDPCIIATKNWSGNNKGFLIATKICTDSKTGIKTPEITANFGNGSGRADLTSALPGNFTDGWMHVAVVIDKANSLADMYLDFKLARGDLDISIFKDESITQSAKLVIGQQLNGSYADKLNAAIDELMVFGGALNENGIRALSKYYGVEKIAYNSVIELPEVGSIRNPVEAETPDSETDAYINSYVDKYIGNELVLYLPFDSDATAAVTGQTLTSSAAMSYEDGVFGNAIRFKDGKYVTVDGISLGTESKTFAFWLKLANSPSDDDPVLFGSKYWSGATKGFIFATKQNKLWFNLGAGNSVRTDHQAPLLQDFAEGWMHVTLVVDRENSQIKMYLDFNEVSVTAANTDIADLYAQALSEVTKLYIGNDERGSETALDAAMDEFMVFDGALSETSVRALSKYFGVEELAYGNVVEIPEIVVEPEATIRDHVNVTTPTKNNSGYIGNFIIDKNLEIYLPFDGNTSAVTGQTTVPSGTVSYEEGFFGEALRFKDGNYVTVNGVELGADDYTFAFWFKMENDTATGDDPIFLATKSSWYGQTEGFVVATKDSNMMFALGDGTDKSYYQSALPTDFKDGWCHLIVSVDRVNGTVTMYYDFGAVTTVNNYGSALSDMAGDPLSYITSLVIGNRVGGGYTPTIDAAIDELMVFNGAFDATDARALSKYYGVEKAAFGDEAQIDGMGTGSITKILTVRNPNVDNDLATPDKSSDKYVTNFIKDKNLALYVSFDGASTTTLTGQTLTTTVGSGSLGYQTGVFGSAMKIENGAYATVSGIDLGAGSYTFSFWIKMETAPTGDPAILATKDWTSGATAGFIIFTKGATAINTTFADGNSSNRKNMNPTAISDAQSGWVHVTVVIDKTAKKMHTYFDFKLALSVDLNDALVSQTITQTTGDYASILRIGQDLEANYSSKLNAAIDELMVFEGALSADEVRALSSYYGLESVVFAE